jgi:predicted phage terminase large subunit-like protein
MSNTAFDISLFPWQQEVWESEARFRVIAAGRRTGKSRLAAYLLLFHAITGDRRADYIYVAPTQGQARDIMWKLLIELGEGIITGTHVNNLEITLANGAVIRLKGGDRPDTMRGLSIAMIVLDEYADIKEQVWEEILRPALADRKGLALFIGTPKGRNHFYELYKKAEFGAVNHAAFHYTSYDNPLIDPQEIEDAKATMSSHAFRQEFMASFESAGSEMFQEEWIIFEEKEPVGGDYYIAVDPAGFVQPGQRKNKKLDDTAIAVVKAGEYGWWVRDIIHGRWSLDETTRKIFDAVATYRPARVGIERGIAQQAIMSPLQDMQRRTGRYFPVEMLTHGNKNKIDRVMWALQGRFEKGQVKLNTGDWNATFLDQLYQFPDPLTHDDLLDALAYIDQLATIPYTMDEWDEEDYEPLDDTTGY